MPSSLRRLSVLSLGIVLLSASCASHPQRAASDLMQEGQAYVRSGNYDAAVIEFQRVLQLEPRSADAYLALGRVELSQGHWPQAYAALRESINIAPHQVEAELDLARLYLQSREFDNATQAAQQVLVMDPSSAAAHQVLAAVDAATNHPRQAQREFARITVLTPRDADAWINLALADANLQDARSARADLQQAITVEPHAALAYADLVNLDLEQKQPALARQVLQQGLAASPDSVRLWLRQAELDDTNTSAWRNDLQTLLARQPHSARAALAVSHAFAAHGDAASAQSVAAAGAREHPDDGALAQQLIDCDMNTGRLQDAQTVDAAWLRRSPSDSGARLSEDRLLLARGQAAAALPDLRQLAQQNPNSASVHYTLGLAEWQAGSRTQAVQEESASLAESPDSPQVLKTLAGMYLAQGHPSQAQDYATRYIGLHNGADGQELLGRIALQQGLYTQALQQFATAGLANSSQAADHVLLAQADAGAGRAAPARSEYARAIALAPGSSEIAGDAIHYAVQQRDWTSADKIVAEFGAARPRDAHGPWLAATVAMARQQWEPAARDLHQALAIQPGFVEAELDLGRIRQQTGPWTRAVYWYQQAAQREPNFAPLLTLIGNLYLQQRQWDTAASYYQRALAAQPDFALAAANLAWVKTEQNQDLSNALILAQKADHEMPDVASVDDTLAWVYYKLGSYGSALPLLRHCVSSAPAEPLYRFHLGMALLASGDRRAGADQLRQALALSLPAAEAKDAQEALRAARG